MEFLLCVLQYLIIAIAIAAIGVAGAFIGIFIRKKMDAKKKASETEE